MAIAAMSDIGVDDDIRQEAVWLLSSQSLLPEDYARILASTIRRNSAFKMAALLAELVVGEGVPMPPEFDEIAQMAGSSDFNLAPRAAEALLTGSESLDATSAGLDVKLFVNGSEKSRSASPERDLETESKGRRRRSSRDTAELASRGIPPLTRLAADWSQTRETVLSRKAEMTQAVG